MADCAAWAVAVETGRQERPRFLAAYWAAIDAAHLQAIEASVVGPAMHEAARRISSAFDTAWEGTAEELLEKLAELAGVVRRTKAKGWPTLGPRPGRRTSAARARAARASA